MTQSRLALCAVLWSAPCALMALGCAPDKPRCESESPAGAEPVVLMARDDVCLAADLYLGPGPDRAVVLVHGAVGDRGWWPADFVEQLQAVATVLVIDRRGVGDSELGPARGGETDARVLDIAAAVAEVNSRGFGYLALVSAGEANAGAVAYAGGASGVGLISADHVILAEAGPDDEELASYATLAAAVPTARLLVPTDIAEADEGAWLATVQPLAGNEFLVDVGGSAPGEGRLLSNVAQIVDDVLLIGAWPRDRAR